MLGGTVDKFTVPEGGNMYAVDPDWTVELKKKSFADAASSQRA